MPFDNSVPESLMNHVCRHAAAKPDAIALSDAGGSCTYADLQYRVAELSSWLKKANVHCLAIEIDNSIDWVVADLAGMNAGISVVPVPGFFSASQREHVFEAAQVDCLVSIEGDAVPGLVHAKVTLLHGKANPRASKITFTSGSSGTPKAVVLDHEANLEVALSIVHALELVDVQQHVCILPLATLLENTAGVYAPLIKGITVHLAASTESGLSGSSSLNLEAFANCLQERQPESLILVPQLLVALSALVELGMVNADQMKLIAVGGGRVSEGLLRKAKSLGLPVYEGYGLSEAGSVVTLNLPGCEKPGTVGKALPHADIRTSDEGELEVRGVSMVGYLGEPAVGEGWLKTGDIGEIDDDGFVTIKGRISNRFITSFGRNVNPEWVESELTQQPLIAQALFFGEAQATNLALIWTRFDSGIPEIAAIVDEINEALPDYARIHDFLLMEEAIDPGYITANGRLKRAAVIEHYGATINEHFDNTGNRHAVL